MEKIRNLILESFDIRKLAGGCNAIKCSMPADSEVFIYEYTTRRKTGIATLYLCKGHLEKGKEVIKTIKSRVPSRIIQSSITNY